MGLGAPLGSAMLTLVHGWVPLGHKGWSRVVAQVRSHKVLHPFLQNCPLWTRKTTPEESLVGQLAMALTIEIVQVLLQLARLATWIVVGRYQEMNGHMIARKNGCATENVAETETTIGTRIVTGDPITVGSEMTDVQTTALVHPMTADLYLQVTGATIHATLVGTTRKHLRLRSRLVTIESLPMHVRHRVIWEKSVQSYAHLQILLRQFQLCQRTVELLRQPMHGRLLR